MKKDWEQFLLYLVVWSLFVVLCGLLGDIFPTSFQTQAKYDVFEEQNWIIYLPDNSTFYYELQTEENGNQIFYIEAGEGCFAQYYLESGMMVVSGESIPYKEKFLEMVDVLLKYCGNEIYIDKSEQTDYTKT